MIENIETLSLSEIAAKINKNWGLKVNFAARPYLYAMSSLDSVEQNYGEDSGRSIVAYFLSNASTWRGEVAKQVKAELNRRIKSKK